MVKKYIPSLCTGVFLISSFPPFNLYPLAWIAFLPLLKSIMGKTPVYAFRMGFFCGCVFFLGILYWIVYALAYYGNIPLIFSLLLFFLLVLYLALYFGVFCYFIQLIPSIKELPIFIAALWTSLEYIRAHFISGFPWDLLGDSQYKWLSFIQMADLGGVYLLSFFVMWGNATLFEWFNKRNKKFYLNLLLFCLCFILALFYGQNRLCFWQKRSLSAPKLKISLIQGNIDQGQKWDPSFQEATIKIYKTLTKEMLKDQPSLIIWPETALPFYFEQPSPLREEVLALAKHINTSLLVGSPAYEGSDEVRFFNRAYLVDAKAKVIGCYDKVHLVPFGEYTPGYKWFPFLSSIIPALGNFSAGKNLTPLCLNHNYCLAVLICFEGIFPELSRKTAGKGASFLVNITNDAWFGRTSAPYQHLAMAAMRTVENRRAMARCANTGFSAFIDPTGHITKKTKLFKRIHLTANLPLIKENTFYTLHGDILAFICLGGIFILGIKDVKRRLLWKKLKKD